MVGAALAAACSARPAALDAQAPPEAAASDVLSRARRVLAETRAAPPASAPAPRAAATPAEAARARAVLDRYYALSAEAQAANAPRPNGVESSPKAGESAPTGRETTPAKTDASTPLGPRPRAIRTPADSVFREFDTRAVAGPICVKYVVCGGGTAAWAAIDAILEEDPGAAKDILLVADELHYPYNRTVLSKELWEEDKKDLFRDRQAAKHAVEYGYKFAKPDIATVAAVRGKRIVQLDVDTKAVVLSDGTKLNYDKFLLATGGTPRGGSTVSMALEAEDVAGNVSVFRTLDDYQNLKASLEKDDTGVIVIGGGFLGTELAIALASSSKKVSLVVAEAGVLYRVLPRYLCAYLARRLSNIGVNVLRSAVVTGAAVQEGVVSLDIASPDGSDVQGGNVVVAVGIDPSVELAQSAGLELDSVHGGVVVNDFMMAEPDVFAAGDVASFHDRSLGRRRVEHWDHAVVSGRIAGKNMAGLRARYGLQSMFWSDLDNIGVTMTAVGRVEAQLETVGVWNLRSQAFEAAPSANEYVSGVVYYVKDGELVGAVLWNPKKGAGGLRRARALIDAKTRLEGMDESTLAALVNLGDAPFRTTVRTKAT